MLSSTSGSRLTQPVAARARLAPLLCPLHRGANTLIKAQHKQSRIEHHWQVTEQKQQKMHRLLGRQRKMEGVKGIGLWQTGWGITGYRQRYNRNKCTMWERNVQQSNIH